MKTRIIVSILILTFAVLIVIESCATTPQTQKNREGVTQEDLFESVKSGDYSEVKRLIEEGTDVNAKDSVGWIALMWASHFGHTEIAKLLIESGADVNTQTKVGATALRLASQQGHREIANLLIEAGAK